jgi:hypothetical protein
MSWVGRLALSANWDSFWIAGDVQLRALSHFGTGYARFDETCGSLDSGQTRSPSEEMKINIRGIPRKKLLEKS